MLNFSEWYNLNKKGDSYNQVTKRYENSCAYYKNKFKNILNCLYTTYFSDEKIVINLYQLTNYARFQFVKNVNIYDLLPIFELAFFFGIFM